MQSLVLTLPDFSKVFVVEIDVSGSGIDVVLMQDHYPIAFISKALNIHQKELLAVVFAIQKWRHYLSNTHFIIIIDHKSL